MNLLITGANGQLGNEMRNVLKNDERFDATFADIVQNEQGDTYLLDITDENAIEQCISERAIDVIVNCAAFTAVDAAEDNQALCRRLNADAVALLANAAKRHGARFIHISTDYVFDGQNCEPYAEDHPTNPQSVYGATKLEGERHLREILPDDHVIIRTAWLYSPYGKNFVKTMLELGRTKPELNVVFDQVGTPTCAHDLAEAIVQILAHDTWHAGTYHFSNEGVCSWYDFTIAIHRLAGITTCNVKPCHSDQFPAKAHRPHFSVLDKTKIKDTFGISIPHWEQSLSLELRVKS